MDDEILNREEDHELGNGMDMAHLISSKDWSQHPMGRKEDWPPLFKSLLSTVLGNRFPMIFYWGPELYCFYNDAFRPSLGSGGKHPGILGKPAKEAWAEAWDSMGPRLNRVFSDGESLWSEDELVPIVRNNRMEDVNWTYSYSPVRGDANEILGLLVTCVETTDKVQALAQARSSESLMRSVVQQVSVAVAFLKGPRHVVEIVNESALEVWGRDRSEVEGKPILEAMPELVEQGFGKLLDEALAGKPFHAKELPVLIKRANEIETVYLNFTYEPLRGVDGSVEGVIAVGADVTETILAKRRAEAGELRFRLLADSMPQFVWTGNADGELNYFNHAVYEYSGISVSELDARGWLTIVHPDEQEANIREWTEGVKAGKDFFFEHRFRRKDGEYR